MTITAPPFRTAQSPPGRHGMKSIVLIGVAVVLAVAAVVVGVLVFRHPDDAGTLGSGVSRSETRAVPAFSAIELAGTNKVTVRVGVPQRVVVQADSNLVDNVVTQVRSGVLVVSDHGGFTTRVPMSVHVTVPLLRAATLSGTGELTVQGVTGRTFTVQLSGTGKVIASGSVDRLDSSISGTGALHLAALVSRDVTVAVNGTGVATVHATRSLHASLAGVGSITYGGHPEHVATDVTGTGQITAS